MIGLLGGRVALVRLALAAALLVAVLAAACGGLCTWNEQLGVAIVASLEQQSSNF